MWAITNLQLYGSTDAEKGFLLLVDSVYIALAVNNF